MQGSLSLEIRSCLPWMVKSKAYQIDHRFFFNDVLQMCGFCSLPLVSTINRNVDPNLQDKCIYNQKFNQYWSNLCTCCAKFLDAMEILVHIFLPSWYLDSTLLGTLQCFMVGHLTFHMQTMFGKKWLNQGQYPERSTVHLKRRGYDYEEYLDQRPLLPLLNNRVNRTVRMQTLRNAY